MKKWKEGAQKGGDGIAEETGHRAGISNIMRHPQPGALPTMVTHITLGPGVFCGQVDIPGTWDFQLQN